MLCSEPNDDLDFACWITLPFSGRFEINPPGETDFFHFSLDSYAEVIIDVEAQSIGSELDAVLILWDQWGDHIAYSDDADGLDPFLTGWLEPGEYFIQVAPYNGHGAGVYELRVEAYSGH